MLGNGKPEVWSTFSVKLRIIWPRVRTHTIYGACLGAAWFVIYDKIFCPHERTTRANFLAAHAAEGALFTATFYHPASFVHGAILGFLLGGYMVQQNAKSYPENFRV